MKVIHKNKGINGASLSINVLYGAADVKAALKGMKKRQCQDITREELVEGLSEYIDKHMPIEQRRYIAEWMADRAVAEGFIFNAGGYLGGMEASDVFVFDSESINGRKVGRPKKNK